MSTIIATWRKNDLFKLLTEDTFFAALALSGLDSSSEYKKELVRDTMNHIRKIQQSESENNLDEVIDPNSMPIFKFIKKHAESEKENRKFAETSSTSLIKANPVTSTAKVDKDTGHVKDIPTKAPWSFQGRRNQNAAAVENAASAEVSGTVDPKTTKFTGPVKRDKNVMVMDPVKNRSFPYLAVVKESELCAKCYPDGGTAAAPCKRWCYRNKCHRCSYYGHNQLNCMQTHSVAGVPLAAK